MVPPSELKLRCTRSLVSGFLRRFSSSEIKSTAMIANTKSTRESSAKVVSIVPREFTRPETSRKSGRNCLIIRKDRAARISRSTRHTMSCASSSPGMKSSSICSKYEKQTKTKSNTNQPSRKFCNLWATSFTPISSVYKARKQTSSIDATSCTSLFCRISVCMPMTKAFVMITRETRIRNQTLATRRLQKIRHTCQIPSDHGGSGMVAVF
mmetsp:Transcript_15235/g.28702  ORF Transcript_15235/g.28702 Transcript_15235/m.28702 type:complete len:210 (-) Transcript_15235:467-1096(-)